MADELDPKIAEAYPEHAKLHRVKDVSQEIGEFIDHTLPRLGLTLCEGEGRRYYPTSKTISDMLAYHFDIDQSLIESEKREMIEEMKRLNERSS